MITIIPLFLIEEYRIHSNGVKSLIDLLTYKRTYILVCFLLTLVSVIRADNVGIDLINYREHFINDDLSRFEIGFYALSKSIRWFTYEFSLYKELVTIIILVPIFTCIYLMSHKKWISLFLFQTMYLYASSMSLLRQYLSITFLVMSVTIHFSLKASYKRSFLELLLLIISGLMHNSALIFIIILPISYRLILSKKNVIFIVVGSLALFFMRSSALKLIFDLILSDKSHYLSTKPEIGETTILIFSMFLAFLIIYKYKNRELLLNNNVTTEFEKYNFTLNLVFFSLVFSTLYSWIPNHARFIQNFSVLLLLTLPEYLLKDSKRWISAVIIIFFIIYFTHNLRLDLQGVVPYLIIQRRK